MSIEQLHSSESQSCDHVDTGRYTLVTDLEFSKSQVTYCTECHAIVLEEDVSPVATTIITTR